MMIDSGVHTYTIIARLCGDGRRLIARDAGGRERLLVMADNPALIKRLIPLFHQFAQNPAFGDFVEAFPYEDGFCAVFAYCGHVQPLGEVLPQAPYEMRAAMLRALFAKLLSQDMPMHLLPDILRPENLLYLPGGDIGFVYDLHFDGGGLRLDKTGAMLRLSAIVDEMGGGAALEALNELRQRLENGGGDTWAELYAAASMAADALEMYRPPPEPVKPPLRERIAGVRDALTQRIGVLTAMVLLVLGYILLALFFYQTVIDPKPADNGLAEIGTVDLRDDGEE